MSMWSHFDTDCIKDWKIIEIFKSFCSRLIVTGGLSSTEIDKIWGKPSLFPGWMTYFPGIVWKKLWGRDIQPGSLNRHNKWHQLRQSYQLRKNQVIKVRLKKRFKRGSWVCRQGVPQMRGLDSKGQFTISDKARFWNHYHNLAWGSQAPIRLKGSNQITGIGRSLTIQTFKNKQ